MSDLAAEEIRSLKAEVARLTNALDEKNASFCTHCKTLFPRGREGFEQFKKHIPDCPSHPLAAILQQNRKIFSLAKRVHARAVAAESERDRLRGSLATIRVMAREQCQKPGAPVNLALDFIVALDRILNEAAEALDTGATT